MIRRVTKLELNSLSIRKNRQAVAHSAFLAVFLLLQIKAALCVFKNIYCLFFVVRSNIFIGIKKGIIMMIIITIIIIIIIMIIMV